MLEKVKTALRITGTALDEEIQDIIDACKMDLNLTGIFYTNEVDPLIIRAVILYAKIHFSFSADHQRFQGAYDMLKCNLALSKKYLGGDV